MVHSISEMSSVVSNLRWIKPNAYIIVCSSLRTELAKGNEAIEEVRVQNFDLLSWTFEEYEHALEAGVFNGYLGMTRLGERWAKYIKSCAQILKVQSHCSKHKRSI